MPLVIAWLCEAWRTGFGSGERYLAGCSGLPCAVGCGVSELATAFGLALEMAATLEDVAGTIHAHPTQGEGFQEAALKALGHAIHI